MNTSSPSILEILASGAPGGGATHLRELVLGLPELELEIACSPDGPLLAELAVHGLACAPVPMPRALNPGAWGALARLMRRRRPLVHAHGTRAALAALPVARALGLRTIYTVHGWSCHARGALTPAARAAERVATSLADRVICVATADLRHGLATGLVAARQARVIPNGVDPLRFAPRPAAREPLRRALGLPQDALVAMVVGRLVDQKGQRTFLRAAAELAVVHPGARFVLVGEGPDRPGLEALVRELALGPRVQLLGPRSDLPELLAVADVFVLPSLWEGLPIALLEAMAAGVPAIATPVGGTPELIAPGRTGLLVPPAQVGPLVEAMHTLFVTPVMRRELAAAARARVLLHYTLDAMRQATRDVYLELA